MTTTTAATTGRIKSPPTGTYALDPDRSTVAFKTRHMFGAGAVSGTLAVASGEVVIADPPTDSSAHTEIRAESFATGNARRDKDVRSKRFLHVERFPVIAFRTDRIHRRADGDWTLRGTLTARDVSAPVELTVTSVTTAGSTLSITATGTVDRYAHGITAFKGVAARHLRIEISATAIRLNQVSNQTPSTARG